MSWILLASFAGIFSNTFNFLSRYILKDKDDPTLYAWYFEIVRFVAFTFVAIFDFKLVINLNSIILFVFLGLTEWLSVYWYMKMHAFTQLSVSSIVSRTRIIWIPVIAFFLLRENLKIAEYIGIGILFLGLSITVSPKKFFIDRGINFANLSAFMIALNIVLTKMILPFGSNSVINAIMVLFPLFLFPIFMRNTKKRIKKLFKTNILLKTLAIGINIISVYLLTQALRLGDASKVTALYQGMIILSVLAGIVFLKERKNVSKKLIGAIITVVGVLLLTVF